MNRTGTVLLNLSVALYLFVNGILGFTGDRGEFGVMVRVIFGGETKIIVMALSVCAIAAGILLLFALFRVEVPVTGIIIVIFIVIWLLFIVITDIINPVTNKDSLFHRNILDYLKQLSAHFMVLGALIISTEHARR
ncbi:MAG TPA: hypothetical protein DEQ14_08690 [Treponema sp.]|nr:hypothetical protein [Treponema sp.]